MRIAIDARWIFEHASGIGVHTRELLKGLSAVDVENEYMLLFDSPERLRPTMAAIASAGNGRFTARLFPHGVFSISSQFLLPRLLREERVDVFHSPNYMIPFAAFPRSRGGRPKCVVTIHDVIPLKFRDHAPRSRKSRLFPLFRRVMLEVGRRADLIIAVSECTRRDIIEQLRIPSDQVNRIRVIYNGVSGEFRPRTHPARQTERRTVLYVGRADPYKNCVRLVEAFALAAKQSDFPVDLLMVGGADPRYPEARLAALRLGINNRVRWTALNGRDLVEAYRDADVLVLPSLYEGFGLPVAEAMACGTPVICGDRGALPEVAGDAAIQIDPTDTEGLATGIMRVLTDRALAAGLVEKGLKQSARFTWQHAAKQTAQVYRASMVATEELQKSHD
jgi:alpha-1,3-rhamnosyl/mannosyltransferase